jgi:DNA invertase Pin-like site-specific DNA recombinase
MAVYAYLRVSTERQDVANQRYGLFEYAHRCGLGTLQFVEDTTSGRLAWRERAVGQLLTETVQAGDVVLFAEISRMARSTLQVLEILEQCMTRGVTVHIAKQQMVLNGSMQSRIAAIVLGLAAEIEREFISLRTTEALAKRRAAGKPLGRPKGSLAPRVKLDAKAEEIQRYLAIGLNKRAIAKLVRCSPTTLYGWLARRHGRVGPGGPHEEEA